MLINVIGIGYIGLPTALALATKHKNIVATDIDEIKITSLLNGKMTFFEKGLDELYQKAKDNLRFTTNPVSANIYIIAVPTPFIAKTKKIDMSYITTALENILIAAPDDAIIVIESTVAPGSIDYIRPMIRDNIKLAHAPERILPGNMLYELEHNSRVIGTDESETAETLKSLYSSFCKGKIHLTDIRTAEMIKIAENAFRAVNIAYANELLMICDKAEVDVRRVIEIANEHPRVNIASPGPGVGGHCIPIDPQFLVGEFGKIAKVIKASLDVNKTMPRYVYKIILKICEKEHISRIGIYGLTYKKDVDDTRESPSLDLLDLVNHYLNVTSYDPYLLKQIVNSQVFSFDEFCENCELIVIMVAHSELLENTDRLCKKTVFDTVDCYKEAKYRL